jgi:hypothetical protein
MLCQAVSIEHFVNDFATNHRGELFVDAAEQEQIRTSTPQTTRRSLFNQFKATERQEDFAESAEAEISKIDDVTMGSSRGIKHDLMPNSKKSNQPRAKRSLVGKYLMFTS